MLAGLLVGWCVPKLDDCMNKTAGSRILLIVVEYIVLGCLNTLIQDLVLVVCNHLDLEFWLKRSTSKVDRSDARVKKRHFKS